MQVGVFGGWTDVGVLGGGWTRESRGGRVRGGWINELVYLVSVGGRVRVCVRVFSVGFGPGLDSMSPARSRCSASHAVGTHGRLHQKNWAAGLSERRGRWIQFAQCSPRPWHCGTPTTSRLYPFGAGLLLHNSLSPFLFLFFGIISWMIQKVNNSAYPKILYKYVTHEFILTLLAMLDNGQTAKPQEFTTCHHADINANAIHS